MGRRKKITGAGDIIASITEAIGIEECDGCTKRKEKLNNLFPIGALELEDDEREYLGTLFASNPDELNKEMQNKISSIYFRCYRVKPFDPCTNCPGVWNSFIKKLKKLL
jgi:hypothetical protein